MRGKTARLAGDHVPVHPCVGRPGRNRGPAGQEGDAIAEPVLPRRSGSEKRQRSTLLAIRLTADERALIEARAERAGLTAASYARQALFDTPPPRQVRRPPVERRELSRLLGEIGHVGGNLNQLAHAANTGVPTDRTALLTILKSLVEVRNAILEALGRLS